MGDFGERTCTGTTVFKLEVLRFKRRRPSVFAKPNQVDPGPVVDAVISSDHSHERAPAPTC
jgi:hypothetical protein